MTRRLRFIAAEQLIAVHEMLLQRWGGEQGGGHRGAEYEGADAAVQAVRNSYYDRIEELAAAYAVYVVQGHVFLDGNKRAGAAAMLLFLEANGEARVFRPLEIAERMIELQARSESGERADELIAWLAAWLAAHPPRRRRRRRSSL